MHAPTQATAAPVARSPGRRLWFDLHSWVGLKLCLFMGFVCLTGTLAVFAHEIDWLLHEEVRVTPGPERASWGTMVAAAQSAHPDWTLEGLSAPHASRFAAMAQMRLPDGSRRFVWVDPYRGVVTGDTHWFTAHRFLRNTHRHLMIPVKYGVPLVAALSLPLLVTLVSSLYIYKRWWRGFFSWPRADRPRRLWGDLHRLLGVWSLWFIALIALTGGWYLVESLGGKAPVPARIALPEGDGPAAADPQAIDRAVDALRARWPALEVRGAQPTEGGQGLLLDGQAEAWLVRDRANAAGFDLRTGTLIDQRDGREMGVHQRIAEMADPLHFGSFGGWPVRLLWFLFGAAMTALSFTGVYLYGLRVSDAARSALRRRRR
ncbi:PepSY-associated TM helix domain-containing protein [Luteimonas sp. M1R5S18]|uniref:PepSY-associated TM helix domain-containing protein n=1 Tax=Luteimonas rhizosphaericola TaxID=3042024 RepID=A0ABT6JNJ9_9GAMM|nr:PepSY-associated TM helix domain-containing protein [Luteimonas rhizosphaericola]MDH5831546.1 PepSY-associated TM helix domain-containing protein [Luteimonas rhizosphaericola]